MRRSSVLVSRTGVVAVLAMVASTAVGAHSGLAIEGGNELASRTVTIDSSTGDRVPTDRRTTAVRSEGLAMLGVPPWHAASHTGEGVTVAVLDVGFDGLENVPADDLPADVVAVAFDNDGKIDQLTDHGTQMAEIVHDVAPGADLVVMTFADDRFAEAVAWMESAGVDVVSFSMEWTDGPLDGTHWTAPIIQASIDAGIVWVVAAGNSAEAHHNGTTTDVDGDEWIELTTGGIEQNGFTVQAGDTAEVSLSWSNPATDLDLCLFDMQVLVPGTPPALLSCTETRQGSGEPATELLKLRNDTGTARRYGYGVIWRSGPQTTYETRTWDTGPLAYANPAASIGVPGNMADVVTVGAVAWNTGNLQPYSAWGPNHMGDRKPEVVGPDEIATSAWAGGQNSGTSYAAPHVAGLIALMLGAAPEMSPAQVKKRLTGRASRATNPDYKHGWGIAQLGSLPSVITSIRGHWAEVAIDWAFTTGVTGGCPTLGLLTCPNLAVTRDEMASFLWQFRGMSTASAVALFDDVPTDASYGPAVDWLAEAKVTLGCTPVAYCPDGTVTRAEMATFLWRMEGELPGSPNAGFDDVTSSSFAVEAIDWLLESGITVGCSSTSFCPQGLVTRAEIFTFLRRLETATT